MSEPRTDWPHLSSNVTTGPFEGTPETVGEWCVICEEDWPCEAEQMRLSAAEARTRVLAELRERVEGLRGYPDPESWSFRRDTDGGLLEHAELLALISELEATDDRE